MGLKQMDKEGRGGFAKVWSATDKGGYSECKVTTGKSNKDTGEYEVNFMSNFVRFRGNAYDKIKNMNLTNGQNIVITSLDTQNCYKKKGEEKLTFTKDVHTVWDFEVSNGNGNEKSFENTKNKTNESKNSYSEKKTFNAADDDDELPF